VATPFYHAGQSVGRLGVFNSIYKYGKLKAYESTRLALAQTPI